MKQKKMILYDLYIITIGRCVVHLKLFLYYLEKYVFLLQMPISDP